MASYFTPVLVCRQGYANPYVRRKRNPFNDQRLYATWSLMKDRLLEAQSIAVQQISRDSSEATRFYRFLSNDRISLAELIKMNCTVTSESLNGRHVLVLGDSTSFNLSKRLGRIQDPENLGVLQDGQTPGFFAHVNLAVDAEQGAILGLADVLYWARPKGVKSPSKSNTPLEDKETYKWHLGAKHAQMAMASAQQLTFVFDRGADSFELLDYLCGDLKTDFVIRSQHDRKIKWRDQELLLSQCLEESPPLDTYQVDLPALDHYSWTSGKRVRRQARKATIEVRAEKVELLAPKKIKASQSLALYIVEAKEIDRDLPQGEQALLWRLWTTHPVESTEAAKQIIAYYLLRWIIEQLFRTIKKKGFNQEATELESVQAILRQTTMVLDAAAKVLQLVYARNRQDAQPIEDAFDRQQQKVLVKVNERLQGRTEKQKNPFPQKQLSWAAWIIARLGGWKGYQSQRPPGPMTMKRGLDKFNTMYEAYELFNSS